MWSEKLPNGKVKFRERCEDPMTGKEFKVSVTMDKNTASTRRLAQAALNDKINERLANVTATVRKENLRLSELVELYRADQKATVSLSTYQRNVFATNALINILGGDTLVDRLSAGYVRERLCSGNEKPGTVNERITRLKALIRWGYQNDYIDDIRWIYKVKKLKDEEKAQKLEQKYLESDELKLLLDNLSVEKWRLLTEFTALSGLRIGEAIALEASDVDFENRYIHVRHTFDPINEVVTTPKTTTSAREVYMQDELLKLCKRIRIFMNKEKLYCGYQTDLFFSDINGNHLDYYAYNKYLCENALRVLNKKVTTHFMRHTHTALMAEQGIPLDVISRRLGHANSQITKDIYFHVTKKMKERDNLQVKSVKIL